MDPPHGKPRLNAATLSALADPNRLRIVELLRAGPLAVGEIAERLGLHQPQASKHLRVLGEAGLVTALPSANRRIYRLRPEPLQELDAWLSSFSRTWVDQLDRLDDYLERLRPPDG
ncbi:helix-turn-helix transcriptional regulator [Cohnella sp. REN36]|uniref:ArsR/SmtB family transcription factor n=1 Tax=Cohnella sp. REN36 TaxID=2887347 RepID=UPI001D136894|nr:metalloregulator ArsR/SmtB family transcription factor [Cohnella sp. REN36]MCC3371548.1 metalloregulator ArsR/SmtB family transcription factor [Cohnella sp. REN36]